MKRGQERNSRICDILSDSRRIEFSKDHFVESNRISAGSVRA
jgi:hypothetical protein